MGLGPGPADPADRGDRSTPLPADPADAAPTPTKPECTQIDLGRHARGRGLRSRPPGTGSDSRISRRAPATPSPSRPATSTRRPGTVLVRFVNDRGDGVGFSFDLSIDRGRSDERHRPHRRPRQALRRHARRRGRRPRRSSRARSSGSSGRTAPARPRRCGSSPRSCARRRGDAEIAGWSVTRNPDEVRRVLGFMPDVVRGLRRHEGLGVPRLLRPLLRHPARAAGGG